MVLVLPFIQLHSDWMPFGERPRRTSVHPTKKSAHDRALRRHDRSSLREITAVALSSNRHGHVKPMSLFCNSGRRVSLPFDGESGPCRPSLAASETRRLWSGPDTIFQSRSFVLQLSYIRIILPPSGQGARMHTHPSKEQYSVH